MRRFLLLPALALACALSAIALWRATHRTPTEGEPSGPTAPDGSVGDPTTLAGAGIESTPGDPARSPTRNATSGRATYVVSGRVVDDHRRPLEGAAVTVRLDDLPDAVGRTGRDGRFRVEVSAASAEWRRGSAHVVDRVGRVALEGLYGWPGEIRAGTLEVGEVVPLAIRVTDAGLPSPGARVLVWCVDGDNALLRVADTTAGKDGSVTIPGLPSGMVHVMAIAPSGQRARGQAAMPRDTGVPLEVAVQPEQTLEVIVLAEPDRKPVAGAAVRLWSVLEENPGRFAQVDYEPRLTTPSTDSNGRTTIRGLCLGEEVNVLVEAAGCIPHRPDRHEMDENPLVVLLSRGRTISWPLRTEKGPIPPSGSEVRIREWPGESSARLPRMGRIEGDRLVIDGVEPGTRHGLATAPDGAIAELHLEASATEGLPAGFYRPRRVDVHLIDEDGGPVAGIVVKATTTVDERWTQDVLSNRDGHAVLGSLPAREISVRLCALPSWAILPRDFEMDLTTGDERLDIRLGSTRHVLVNVRVDGKPRLPSALRISAPPYTDVVEVQEDPDAAAVHLILRPLDPEQQGAVVIAGDGVIPFQRTFDWPPRGTPLVLSADLQPPAVVRASVEGAADVRFDVVLERYDPLSKRWEMFGERVTTPGDRPVPVHEPGTFRLRDLRSGFHSEPSVLAPGTRQITISLDLMGAYRVAGRVELPPEWGGGNTRLVVEGEGFDTAPTGVGEDGPGIGLEFDEDASKFELWVPKGRTVTVRPWHAGLVPDPEAGAFIATGPRDDVVLKMVLGPRCRFRIGAPPGERGPGEMQGNEYARVLLFSGDTTQKPVATLFTELRDEGFEFGPYPPGRYTVWLDLPPYAPGLLRSVDLGPDKTDLGAIQFERGAHVDVRVLGKADAALPEVSGCAWLDVSEDQADKYFRQAEGTGTNLVIRGLGPGHFRAHFQWNGPDGLRRQASREFDVGEQGDVRIELDLR